MTDCCLEHVCVLTCVRACWGGGAVTLTGGCLRFRPGRPTFRAVVPGSCRSSLPRAPSCSSPSCGYRQPVKPGLDPRGPSPVPRPPRRPHFQGHARLFPLAGAAFARLWPGKARTHPSDPV